MRIDQLNLWNFRNVEQQSYYFPTNFTVIIGRNGAGKSAILHGLRVVAGAYLTGISEAKSRSIKEEEIRKVSKDKLTIGQYPVVVEAVGRFAEQKEGIVWRRRVLREGGSTTSSKEDLGNIRTLGTAKYQKMVEEKTDHLDLPLIAYFGTNRGFGTARRRQ